jgi:hypothetical protein
LAEEERFVLLVPLQVFRRVANDAVVDVFNHGMGGVK